MSGLLNPEPRTLPIKSLCRQRELGRLGGDGIQFGLVRTFPNGRRVGSGWCAVGGGQCIRWGGSLTAVPTALQAVGGGQSTMYPLERQLNYRPNSLAGG